MSLLRPQVTDKTQFGRSSNKELGRSMVSDSSTDRCQQNVISKPALSKTDELTKPSNNQTSGDNDLPGWETLHIPVDQIDAYESCLRDSQQSESIKQLTASIRIDGLLQPIMVSKEGERYKLIFGSRRLSAYILLGHKTIPARISVNNTKSKEHTFRIIENTKRENFQPIPFAHALRDCIKSLRPELGHDMPGMINLFSNHDRRSKNNRKSDPTVKSILTMTGCSASTIRNLLNLLRLPETVQRSIDDKRLKPSLGYILANNIGHQHLEDIWKRAMDKKMSKKELEILFQSSEESHDSSEQISVQAKRLMKIFRDVKEQIKSESDDLSYDDADALLKELNQLRSILQASLPPDAHHDHDEIG